MSKIKQKVFKTRTPVRIRAPAPKVRPMLLQPALQVGAVNDPAEREAEVMASRVVASSAPAVPVAPADPGAGAAPGLRRAAEDQPNLDDLDTGSVPAEHADVEVPKTEDVTTEDLEGADTTELDSGKPEDTSGEEPAPDSPPIEDAPLELAAPLRRAETGAVVGRMGGAAPQDVANIVANPGPGRPLTRSLRQRIEPHFGVPFDKVRLHDTAADRRAAARIGARAFTHKNHIWLGDGESETNTRLIAHELTHVVQQTRGAEALPISRAPAPVIRRGYFADKAESVARHVPGYTLITVLVGRKLISGDRVPMTGENLLGGFMGLIPGGTVIFDRLKEARVIEEAFTWVKGKLSELNLTWERIKSDLSKALDTLNPFKAARRVKKMVVDLVRDIVRFVTAIAKKLLEMIVRGALKLAGPLGEKVWGILQRAGEVIGTILEDPLGFAKNLVKAVIGGFKQFGTNIWEHLKKGLLGWLFGSLASAGIEMPAKLDFKGLISIGLQILGLTYANFRKSLVKKLGPKGEKMVSMMETSVEVVKTLLKEGFVGIWQKLLGMIEEFRQTVIGGISEMIVTTIVKAGIGWLAGLSNPVGAIVKVVLSIYNLITAFIERFQQIVGVCESIFSSVAAIAKGQVQNAANFIEQTIGRTIPLIISFLAALIPISGITNKIKSVIKKLQAPVKKAMDKLIGFLVKKAKKLFAKLIGKVNGKRKLPSANFKIGAKQHRIFADKKGKKITIKIATKEAEIDEHEKTQAKEVKLINQTTGDKADESKALAKKLQAETVEADDDTEKVAKVVRPDAKDENQRKRIDKLMKELQGTAKELEDAGKTIDSLPQISSQTEKGLFRAAEPRKIGLEGKHDPHAKLLAQAKEKFNKGASYTITSFYEMDHTMEKRFAKAVLENLPLIDPAQAKAKKGEQVQKSSDRADRAATFNKDKTEGRDAGAKTAVKIEDAKPLGEIGDKIKKIPEDAPDFPAIAVYRHNHVKDKGLKSHTSIVEQARSAEDPHASVKASLKAQFDLEEKEMLAKISADKVAKATPKLKEDMIAGIAAARLRNNQIFGLDGVKARQVKPGEKKTRKNDTSSSELNFKGGNGAPNFLETEGVGAAYSTLKDTTEHLERDHIVDKAYPQAAAAAPLVKVSEKAELDQKVAALVGADKPLSADQQKRLDEVKSAKLYPASSSMAKYTEAGGFAIPLYKPVAREVTAKTGTAMKPEAIAAKASGGMTNLVEYVVRGKADTLDAARKTRSGPVATVLRARTDHHVDKAKAAYAKNSTKVPAQQKPGADAAAKAYMGKIVAQVNNSLARARVETERLF